MIPTATVRLVAARASFTGSAIARAICRQVVCWCGLACQILIVDDDPDIRETLSELLEGEGYLCAGAANGQAALDYLHRQPAPALILLDLMMPVMDGVEFRAAQLREQPLRQIPIVVISASGRSKQVARELAAADYVEKPIDVALLFQKVRAVCAPEGGG